MTINYIHATSSADVMLPDNGNRRFTVLNDGIDATEVQERLDWKALRDMITVDTSLLEFMPTGQHQIAALANLGAELLQEVKAYRPAFAWQLSPAEIIGALIEEMVTPAAVVAPAAADSARPDTVEHDPLNMKNSIPPITDPLGRHWRQPATAHILIDDTHAVMAPNTFEALAEYSGTMPSGVYPGKMWRRHDGLFDQRCRQADRRWLLCWFGEHADPAQCSINSRLILVAA